MSHRTLPLPRTAAACTSVVLALTACTANGAEQAAPPAATGSPTSTPAAGPTPADSTSPSPGPSPSGEAGAADPEPPVDGPVAAELLASGEVTGPVRFTVALRDPASPEEVVEQLVQGEQAVRDEALSQDARLVAAHRTQRAYRLLAQRDEWREEVLAALPDRWRPNAEGNIEARVALDRLLASGDPPTTLPAWEIVEPAPAAELLQHYQEAEEEIGADWELLAAINLVETRMGRIVGLSTAGARGPMQFIPASWAIFGEGDIDDPRDSILAAARHLTQRPGDPPNDRNALLRYNRSGDYADAVLAIADVLRRDPSAYRAYHGWQVYYTTTRGAFLLPVGYRETEPVPIEDYLARDPVDVAG